MNIKKTKRRAKPLQVVTGFTIGMLMVLAGVYFSSLTPVGPSPEALPYLKSSEQVQVTVDTYAYFKPVNQTSSTGLIFYPGGRVDYRSYAPLAYSLAEKGWPAAIVPMPLNLAMLGVNRADWAISDHPEVSHWMIGGHSLGGTFAAEYAMNHPGKINGIVFLASYPSGKKLAGLNMPVLSIFASEDGLITPQERETYRDRVPSDSQWIVIEGGNHAGFGRYGVQEGDNPATISPEEQTNQVVQAIDQFLRTAAQKY